MIFPVLYLIYAVIINFMPIPHLQKVSTDASPTLIYGGISIYGYFTCINPSIHANVFNLNNNPV
jgi:hypothetical protein